MKKALLLLVIMLGTFAPPAAKASAIARPMLRPEPVTIAVRPANAAVGFGMFKILAGSPAR